MTATLEESVNYIAPFKPVFEQLQNGKFAVRNVPIFKCHDDRGWECDAEWMRETVSQQFDDKRNDQFLPRLIEGHTTDETDKPAKGSLDNFRFDEGEGVLFADILDIPKELMERMEEGEFPGRSVEVFPSQNRISALALLGGHKPFFELPDMKFNNTDKDKPLVYQFKYDDHPEDHDDNKKKAGEPPQKFTMDEQTKSALRDFILEVVNSQSQHNADGEHKEDYQMSDDNKKTDEPGKVDKQASDDAGVSRQDYSDLNDKFSALETANGELSAKLLGLEEASEAAKWTKLYADKRIPSSILDVEKHTAYIMKLDSDNRQEYYDNTISLLTPPSTTRTKVDAEGKVEGAVDQADFNKFYNDNRAKYAGDTLAAMKDFKREQRVAGNPQYTG